MKTYTLTCTQDLPISISEAWSFFSNPRNLSRITPASLDFKIISNPPQAIYSGLEITYTVRPLCGIPMQWVSSIKEVNGPVFFVDEQRKGPYQYWRHEHRFTEIPNGVRVEDKVIYAVGYGLIGQWIHPILVKPQLDQIFNYRRDVLKQIFKT